MPYLIVWHENAQSGALVVERDPVDLEASPNDDDAPRDLAEALEAMTANDSYEWLTPEDVGALTDAPIIGRDVKRDDATGEVLSAAAVWWFPQYETVDPLAELVAGERLIFTRVPENDGNDPTETTEA